MRKDNHTPYVVAACTSGGGIPKWPKSLVCVSFAGLAGDEHHHAKHNTLEQAVSLQDEEVLEELKSQGFNLQPGTTGENLTVRRLGVNQMEIGTILEFPGGAILELTKVRKPCYVLDKIDPRLQHAILGRCGFYAKVLKEGLIQAGDTIQVKEKSCLSIL